MKSISRREFLRSASRTVALGTALSLTLPAIAEDKNRPNILFIMSDDHAAHAISCYGSRINKTPNIDRIAEQGMRFNNCFCTNSICGPSRAVILTGKYSHKNGFMKNGDKFDSGQQSFPKLLGQAGYQTAMIGKWHLASDPQGFDHWKVLSAYGGQGTYFDPKFKEDGKYVQEKGYVTDIITDDCIEWVKNRDKNRPFCLMYHHKAPHRSWEPDEKHAKMYEDIDIPLPETFDDDYATRSDAARQQEMTVEKHFNKQDLKFDPPADLKGHELKKWKYQRYIKDYLRCIASVDDNIGRMMELLKAEGLEDNTIVVYTSDQGFFLGDHGWYDKRFMYEESLRMPLVVRYPKGVKAGTTNDDIVSNVDFAETFLDFAGVKIPDDMQGESLRPLLNGQRPWGWRDAFYYHYYMYPGHHVVKKHYGVRTSRYKLIHFYDDIDAWELFDLQKDPNELNNVYDNPKYAKIVKKLKAKIKKLQKKYKDDTAVATKLKPEGTMLDFNFDDIKDNIVKDNSGNGNNGKIINNALVVDGKKSKALKFTGKEYVDVKNSPSLDPSMQTWSAQASIKPDADGVIAAQGGEKLGYMLFIEDGRPCFTVRNYSMNFTAKATEKCIGKWTHIVGVATRNTVTIYVNGKEAATTELLNMMRWDAHEGFQVGRDTNNPVYKKISSKGFKGLIESVRLHRGNLSNCDIEKSYEGC
ncbi:MAG: sulfatase-like hydrolase/transferase [Planctomycetes bacterium]|nr:sulfatase-like hydrolase/transferase [Planctomycetota bacterium]